MSYSIRCDHCKAILKSPVPVPGGKKIKCPKCKQTFVSPTETPDDDAPRVTSIARATSIDPPPKPNAKSTPPAEPEEEIPEIEDELVVPDVEDEPPAKKKRRDQDDDEDEEPRSKKRKRRDEDEDEDEEDADEPRSKKRQQRDEEDDDDQPRKSAKKKKKAGSPLLLIGLIGGGVFALLLCVGCGIGGYFLFAGGPDIVGKWENNDFIKISYEFRADGTGAMQAIGFNVDYKYRLVNGNELELEPTGVGGGGIFANMQGQKTARVRVTREGDILRLEEMVGPRRGQVLRLRKVN